MTSLQPDVTRLGAQTPRVANYPSYSRSAASEIIDLAGLAGLVLDPWQRYVLTHGLGELDSGQWAATKVGVWCPRQNGKGGIIEALELGWLFLLREPLILHSAHEYKTSSEAFKRISHLIRNCADLDRRVERIWTGAGEQGIELTRKAGGGRLRFVARSRTSGRGFSGDKNVLDEAQELTVEQMAAMMPTMSARPNPQMWFLGTPPADDAGSAWCYELREDGEAGARRVAWFDWGADLDRDDPAHLERLADRDLWYACNPALGIRIAEEFVEDELLPSGLGAKFASERLGVWPARIEVGAATWQVITEHAWTMLRDPASEIPQGGALTFALDVAPNRGAASIAVAGARADGITHVEVAEWRPGVDWIVPWFTQRRIPRVILDGKGAAGFADALYDAGVDVLATTTEQMAAGCGRLFDACAPAAAGLRHRGQPVLDAALAGATTRPLGGAWAWDRRKAGADITPLVAVTLALWAHAEAARPQPSSRYESEELLTL